MAEQLLDDAQVRTAVEQVRRERMAERVRRDPDRQSGPHAQTDRGGSAGRAHRAGGRGGSGRSRPAGLVGAAPRRSSRTGRPSSRYSASACSRRTPEQADPLLAPLAQDPDLAAPEVERTERRRCELADAQAGGVGGLDQRAVAQGEREPEGGPLGIVARNVLEIRLDDREQRVDLLDLEDAREPAREARRRDRAPRVARREIAPRRPAMERPDRGQPLRDGRSSATLTEDAEVGAQVGPRRAPPVRAPRGRASRGRRRQPWRRRVACAARRRARRGSGGTARGRDRSSGRPPPRSRVGGRLDRASAFGRRSAAGPRAATRTSAALRRAAAPWAAAGACRPSEGLGVRRATGVLHAGHDRRSAGVSLVEPQTRQIAVSSLRASGPSSVSCRPPSGSWFVVKSQRG